MERVAEPLAPDPPALYHPPVKRSVEIAGHKTSVSLEPLFWNMLKAAAAGEAVPLNALVARIDAERLGAPTPPGLASAIRVWLAGRLYPREDQPGERCGAERNENAAAEAKLQACRAGGGDCGAANRG